MNKEFAVSIRVSTQVSPDDWDYMTHKLKVTDETTIGEISEWVKKLKPDGFIRYMVDELQSVPIKPDPVDDLPY